MIKLSDSYNDYFHRYVPEHKNHLMNERCLQKQFFVVLAMNELTVMKKPC